MTIKIQGPDGNTYEFPDGTDPQIMRSAMQKRFGGPQGQQDPAQQAPSMPDRQTQFSPNPDIVRAPEVLPERGTPEFEQLRAAMQANLDKGQARSDQLEAQNQTRGRVLMGANAVQRFANSATLGVPDRLAGMGIDAKNALMGNEMPEGQPSGYEQVKALKADLKEDFPKSSIAADVGGTVFGLGKVAKAGALPSQLAAKVPGAANLATKTGKLASTTGALALDGAALAGGEALIGGRDVSDATIGGGMTGAVFNVLTRGAGHALSPLLKGSKNKLADTTQQVLKKASEKYDSIKKMEIEFSPQSSKNLVGFIKEELNSPAVGLDKKLHRGTRGLLKDMSEYAGKSMPWRRLQDFQSRAKEIASAGGRDGAAAKRIVTNIDEFIKSNPKTLTGDASKLSNAAKEADALFRQGSNAKTLEDAIDLKKLRTAGSGTGGNLDNNLRQAMTNMLAGKKTSKYLSAGEKEALKKAVVGSKGENAARLFGRGFSPNTSAIHQLATGAMLAKTGGASLPLHLAGFLAKKGSEKAAVSRADDVLRILREGSPDAAKRTQNKLQKTLSDEEKQRQLALLLTGGSVLSGSTQ